MASIKLRRRINNDFHLFQLTRDRDRMVRLTSTTVSGEELLFVSYLLECQCHTKQEIPHCEGCQI